MSPLADLQEDVQDQTEDEMVEIVSALECAEQCDTVVTFIANLDDVLDALDRLRTNVVALRAKAVAS